MREPKRKSLREERGLWWTTVGAMVLSFFVLQLELYVGNIGGVAVYGLFTGMFGGWLMLP